MVPETLADIDHADVRLHATLHSRMLKNSFSLRLLKKVQPQGGERYAE
jgi:hypothetical protein